MAYETPVGAGTPEQGRKEVSTEVATLTQFSLFDLMVPEAVRAYLTESETDPIREALWQRWTEKYVAHFNGLTEYYNDKRHDRDFIERAKSGALSAADYEEIVTFFEESEHGSPFFESEEDITAFLKPFLH